MAKQVKVMFESFILPPGFKKDGYDIFKGNSYLKRFINPMADKTVCSLEYYMPDESLRDDIMRDDYEELKLIGPQEITDGCWLIKGSKPVILTVPHAVGPRLDKGVSQLVFEVQKRTSVNAVISTVSRKIIDYNLIPRYEPFFDAIEELISNGARLLLDIHSGVRGDYDIELGCRGFTTAPSSLVNKIKEIFESNGYKTVIDDYWIGGAIVSNFKKINAVQIEFSRKRVFEDGSIDSLCDVIQRIYPCTRTQNKQ